MSRILIIDDSEDIRSTLVEILTSDGHAPLAACDGPEGLGMLSDDDDGDGFDLVLLDVVMPGMRGDEVLAHIRHSHPGLPVIFMSASGRDKIPDGADGILLKPFSLDGLTAIVARFCGAEGATSVVQPVGPELRGRAQGE